jgi:biotin carboxylase
VTGVVAFVETNLGSPGPEVVLAARDRGARAVLLTRDPDRYANFAGRGRPLSDVIEVVVTDTENVDAVVRCLCELGDVSAVLSTTDYSVVVAAEAAHRLGLPGTAPSAVRAARDKLATRWACAEHGVAVPWFALATSDDDAIAAADAAGWPCIVKPRTEAGSIGVRLCRTPDDVLAASRQICSTRTDFRGQEKPVGVLVEEYLVGPEVSVEVVGLGSRRIVLGVTDKTLGPHPCFVEVGETFPSSLPPATTASVAALALAGLDALGHDVGVAHVEVKLTAQGPFLVEVNARLGGAQILRLVRTATGVDLAAAAVALHAGEPLDLPKLQLGAAASRYLTVPRAGVLREVLGEQEARRVSGVLDVCLYAEPGTNVGPALDNTGVLGHVVAAGSTPAEAERSAVTALGQLQVVLEPGQR